MDGYVTVVQQNVPEKADMQPSCRSKPRTRQGFRHYLKEDNRAGLRGSETSEGVGTRHHERMATMPSRLDNEYAEGNLEASLQKFGIQNQMLFGIMCLSLLVPYSVTPYSSLSTMIYYKQKREALVEPISKFFYSEIRNIDSQSIKE
ncbi:hypothetical protein KIN20_035796 [Parelaphostrongylus tenuis]|uniref:Uncharacterized protein n=1 Tax=Parelaphostrongylus tenuis TaxID=148309 RepID=A0AAD5RBZ4_PARTN|nr:hypothetical protein KIN20_035796 [Parelaphostrongylus tenuis]